MRPYFTTSTTTKEIGMRNFTHKLNQDFQTAMNGELCKGHPVTVTEVKGGYSKALVNNQFDCYIPSEFLTPIEGVVA